MSESKSESKSEYLYGDSTPAPVGTDFIAYLRDLVDFSVQVLLSDACAAEAIRNAEMAQEASERGIVSVESLAADVSGVVDLSERADLDPFVSRCAARIRSTTWDAVRAEAATARAAADAEVARAAQAATRVRADCERALETMLFRQDVPDAVVVIKMGTENGTDYECRLMAQTPFGLSWEVGLQIPASHWFSRVLRIERVVERLEVQVPEEAGWPHRAARVRPLRIDRLYLTELVSAPAEAFMKLRSTPEGVGGGCNVWIHRDPQAVRLERVLANGLAPDAPRDIDGAEAVALHALHEALAASANEIARHRRLPLTAKIDDTPIHQHEVCAVVERLIANVAPHVEEISRRSLSPGELVLRRRLGDNHREEVFLSKSELLEKIEPLTRARRGAFAPLNLWQVTDVPADTDRAPGATNGQPHGIAAGALPCNGEPTVIVEESLDAPSSPADAPL
jgi:hypothetical protein